MGCVPTHATPTCCAGWGCRSPSNLSAGRKVGRLTILPLLAQGPSMLSVPDPHKHFFKDIGEEMARRRPGLDLLVVLYFSTHAHRWGSRRAKGLRLGFWRQKYSYDAGWFGTGAGVLRSEARCPSRNENYLARLRKHE